MESLTRGEAAPRARTGRGRDLWCGGDARVAPAAARACTMLAAGKVTRGWRRAGGDGAAAQGRTLEGELGDAPRWRISGSSSSTSCLAFGWDERVAAACEGVVG
jgi:hypothetical protein